MRVGARNRASHTLERFGESELLTRETTKITGHALGITNVICAWVRPEVCLAPVLYSMRMCALTLPPRFVRHHPSQLRRIYSSVPQGRGALTLMHRTDATIAVAYRFMPGFLTTLTMKPYPKKYRMWQIQY